MKRGLIISIIIIFILAISLGISSCNSKGKLEPPATSTASNCAAQGERFDATDTSKPDKCCEGLDDIHSTNTVSVTDKCYEIGAKSDSSAGVCSDCGNGVCDDVETSCGCAEDCAGKGRSDFFTAQQFCKEGYGLYCGNLPKGTELDLCKLCK